MDPAVQCVQELRADVQNLRSKRRVQSILKFGVYCLEGEHLTEPVLKREPGSASGEREAEETVVYRRPPNDGMGRGFQILRQNGRYGIMTHNRPQLSDIGGRFHERCFPACG